ncbi:MAG TPA: AMP-binding protein, partial [Acidimicrobiales bacterium]|nr:AMP-binding protein [Acidimicrobiales bacterium]
MAGYQLRITSFLARARDFFGDRRIVSYRSDLGSYTYRDYHERVLRAAGALQALGVEPGDRVGTFAWNHHRHLEMYFAAPAAGAVLHTINIRLGPDDIGYIIDHAGDKAVFVDASLLPVLRPVLAARSHLQVVVMADRHERDPAGGADYEDLLARAAPLERLVEVGEDQLAALCYTSGTTGRPKGVPYSHRTLFLHTLAAGLADGHAISGQDTVLHVVPMFHANAWGVPFAAAMAGARQVLPGPHPTAEVIARLIEAEGVTYTGMVPTLA